MEKIILNKLNNNRASVLLITYLVIAVLVTLGAAFLLVTEGETKSVERSFRSIQALYIAEAGVQRAIYDLRQDFFKDSGPSWYDGDIQTLDSDGNDLTYWIGPDEDDFYEFPYSDTTIGGGSYYVELKNVSSTKDIWIQSTGTFGDQQRKLLVYVRMGSISPWDNAIFAGGGASGTTVNGNVDVYGSVHILGTGLSSGDKAIDLGGSATLVRNNYDDVDSNITPKLPALDTVTYNGENVETLHAELRVKHGQVWLSGSSEIGEDDAIGNGLKETVDAVYVSDGWGGTAGSAAVNSDNGYSNAYDLGDAMSFPRLSDSYEGYATYQQYIEANAYVISDAAKLAVLADIKPTDNFSYIDPLGKGSIIMDGNGNMTISGIIYVKGGGVKFLIDGSDKTITYTGKATILSEGQVDIDVNLITPGNNSYPTNILGIMTPGEIEMDAAGCNVMGIFYAENEIEIEKQTNIYGTIVSDFFDMGGQVPAVIQVPAVSGNLPAGMIGGGTAWSIRVVSWQEIDV